MEPRKEYTVILSETFLKKVLEEKLYLIAEGLSHVRASEITDKIIASCRLLSTNPNRFQQDEFLSGRSEIYRRYFIYRYRIVYKVIEKEKQILILGMIHSSQSPSEIKKLKSKW